MLNTLVVKRLLCGIILHDILHHNTYELSEYDNAADLTHQRRLAAHVGSSDKYDTSLGSATRCLLHININTLRCSVHNAQQFLQLCTATLYLLPVVIQPVKIPCQQYLESCGKCSSIHHQMENNSHKDTEIIVQQHSVTSVWPQCSDRSITNLFVCPTNS